MNMRTWLHIRKKARAHSHSLSDEIYEHVLLSEVPFISFVTACPQLRERTLIVNGVS